MRFQPDGTQQNPLSILRELAEISGSKEVADDCEAAELVDAQCSQIGHDLEILLSLAQREEARNKPPTIH